MTTRVSRKDTIGPIGEPKNRSGAERRSSLCKKPSRDKISPQEIAYLSNRDFHPGKHRGERIVIFRERLFRPRKSRRDL